MPTTVDIRGNHWRLFRPNRIVCFACGGSGRRCDHCDGTGELSGYCDQKRKEIRITRNEDRVDLCDTALHETLHACQWDLSEEAVRETVASQMRVLEQVGII